MQIFIRLIFTLKSFFKFFLSLKKDECLLASLPRSGTWLTFGLLNVCYSIQKGHRKDLSINDTGYSTFLTLDKPLDHRSIFKKNEFPSLWHSHMPYNKILPLRKRFCKSIVLIRDPVDGIISWSMQLIHSKKLDYDKKLTIDGFKKIEKKYDLISHYKNFLKTWLKVKKERKKNNSKYEPIIIDINHIKKNPLNYLKFLNNFYNFGFLENQMNSAVEEMDINKVKSNSTSRTSRITNVKYIIENEIKDLIRSRCQEDYENIKKLVDHNLI